MSSLCCPQLLIHDSLWHDSYRSGGLTEYSNWWCFWVLTTEQQSALCFESEESRPWSCFEISRHRGRCKALVSTPYSPLRIKPTALMFQSIQTVLTSLHPIQWKFKTSLLWNKKKSLVQDFGLHIQLPSTGFQILYNLESFSCILPYQTKLVSCIFNDFFIA